MLGKEPVYVDGVQSGYVTSAAYGYSVRKPIAYAWLPGLGVCGRRRGDRVLRRRIAATVTPSRCSIPAWNGCAADHFEIISRVPRGHIGWHRASRPRPPVANDCGCPCV